MDPERLRENLIGISLYICAYEMLEDAIIEKPKTFFLEGFDRTGAIVAEDYKTNVVIRDKNLANASLDWLKEIGVVNDKDIGTFHDVRTHRNELAHEAIEFLSNNRKEIDLNRFKRLVDLFETLERGWFREFEMAVDPDILPKEADPNEVIPGRVMLLRVMLDIALGNESYLGYFLEAHDHSEP